MLTLCRLIYFSHNIKYDLKGHGRSQKNILSKFFVAH